uniref:Uncharacterized protein n=1 Tax=Cacopsylla melanoneura TaxID=428564 RepID=A0A8D8SZM8_9HEMI
MQVSSGTPKLAPSISICSRNESKLKKPNKSMSPTVSFPSNKISRSISSTRSSIPPKKIDAAHSNMLHHHARVENPIINEEKLRKWKQRNYSNHFREGFSDQQSLQVVQSKGNVKNQSNLGPSFLSITFKEPITDPMKHKVSCRKVGQKPYTYKPPLILSQPEYFPTDKSSEGKSLEQIKHINKKYSIVVTKCKSKPSSESTKLKLNPLTLCNEDKLCRELGKQVRPLKKIHQLVNSKGANRNNLRQLANGRNDKSCTSRSEMTTHKIFKHPTTHDDKSIVDSNKLQLINCKCTNEDNSCKDMHNNQYYPRCFGQSSSFSTKENVCLAPKACCCMCKDSNCSTQVDQSDINKILNRIGKYTNNTSCLLHDIVEYRQKNYCETHHSSPKHSQSKPSHQTYILDERLFPVHIENDNANTHSNKDKVHTCPSFNNAKQGIFSKPLVTLKQTQNIPQSVRFDSKLNFSNKPMPNKTEEIIYHHRQSLAPTNSLALKHQKGVMGF